MIFGLFTTSVVAKIAPVLLPLLKEALLKKGTEAIAGKATEGISGWVGKKWTEWQERRHLAQALEKAEHKDAVKFELGEERDQYRDILKVLSQSPHNKTLCQEAVRLLKPL